MTVKLKRASEVGFGSTIRMLREACSLKPSDIERRSREIATLKQFGDFYVSHATLSSIESGASIPSIYKVYSLAVCLELPYEEILETFGVGRPKAPPALADVSGFRFQLNFDLPTTEKSTRLLRTEESRILAQQFAHRSESHQFTDALIGSDDHSMADIVPAGSVVRADMQQVEIAGEGWRTLADRPIYLIQISDCLYCRWCQHEEGNYLMLIPHPASISPVLRARRSREVRILGRVVQVWSTRR